MTVSCGRVRAAEIGRGRFGVVVKAKSIADGETVAIKKISKKGRHAKVAV